MNKVILMGRLTRDPEVRYSAGENALAIARYTEDSVATEKQVLISFSVFLLDVRQSLLRSISVRD